MIIIYCSNTVYIVHPNLNVTMKRQHVKKNNNKINRNLFLFLIFSLLFVHAGQHSHNEIDN